MVLRVGGFVGGEAEMKLAPFKRELELLKRDIRFREGHKQTLLLVKRILEDYAKLEAEYRVKKWSRRVEANRQRKSPIV